MKLTTARPSATVVEHERPPLQTELADAVRAAVQRGSAPPARATSSSCTVRCSISPAPAASTERLLGQPLQHDARDLRLLKQQRQHQPSRTSTDDTHLGLERPIVRHARNDMLAPPTGGGPGTSPNGSRQAISPAPPLALGRSLPSRDEHVVAVHERLPSRGSQGGQQRKAARVKSRLALLAISATPTDGWTTLAFTPARVFVPTAPAWLRVSDLGSGPERRERRSHCRSGRNPRYSVGRPTFFGRTAGVWSPTPTPLPCARHAGHGQASLRMATGDRDGRPVS